MKILRRSSLGTSFIQVTVVHRQKHYQVHAGKNTLEERGSQVSSVKAIIHHEKYHGFDKGYDIALFQLEKPFIFDARVQPVCVASVAQDVPAGTLVIATGWGDLYWYGDQPNSLYQVRLPVVSKAHCENNYKYVDNTIFPSQLCAGGMKIGGIDACEGDTGGPLVTYSNDNSSWYLVGVKSYGAFCADPDYPGIYTRISSFHDLISAHVSSRATTLGWSYHTACKSLMTLV